ncbi:hypothetical protein IWX47DRAFT_415670 [Phyllosticta citricarpa]
MLFVVIICANAKRVDPVRQGLQKHHQVSAPLLRCVDAAFLRDLPRRLRRADAATLSAPPLPVFCTRKTCARATSNRLVYTHQENDRHLQSSSRRSHLAQLPHPTARPPHSTACISCKTTQQRRRRRHRVSRERARQGRHGMTRQDKTTPDRRRLPPWLGTRATPHTLQIPRQTTPNHRAQQGDKSRLGNGTFNGRLRCWAGSEGRWMDVGAVMWRVRDTGVQ